MPVRDVSIRISVIGGDKSRQEINLTGEEAQKAFQKINEATKPANDNLKLINATVEEAKGKFEEFAEHAGALGRVLMALGPVGTAVAVAIGAMVAVIHETVGESEKFEQGQRRLAAILQATGSAAGLTQKQLTDFSEEYAHVTLHGTEEIQRAEAELLTFKSVQGDVFTEAIKLASDTADTWGTDLTSAIRGLGRALDDPIDGLKGLTRAHINLTQAQKDNITALAQSGQKLEAQKAILDAVRDAVGGASEAQNAGVTGAAHQLKEALGELSRAIGQDITDTGILQASMKGLTSVFRGLREEVRATSEEELASLNKRIEQMNQSGTRYMVPGTDWEDPGYEKLVAKRDQVEADIAKEKAAQQQAQANAQKQQYQANNDELLAMTDDFNDKIKEKTQTEQQKIIDETTAFKEKIGHLLNSDGSNKAQIDEALALADQLQKVQIDKSNEKEVEANQKVIDSLKERLKLESLVNNPKQQFVQGEVDKLSPTATTQQITQTKEAAAAVYDLQQKTKAAIDAENAHDRAVQKLNEEMAKSKTSFAQAKEGLDAWRTQMIADLGGVTEANQHYIDVVDQIYNQKLHDAYYKSLSDSKTWQDGAISGLHKYADEATNASKAAADVFSKAADDVNSALVDMATTGKFNMKSLASAVQSLEKDVLSSFMKQNVTGPIAGWFGNLLSGGAAPAGAGDAGGGIFGSIFSSIFHEGGVVGQSAASRRAVPSILFAGAPRFHDGLAPDEFPAILQRGETVIPKGGRQGGPNVVMNINTPNAQSFMESKGQVMAKFASEMTRYHKRNS